ncbi:glycosyltransferase [Halomarina litorea]|uniref:glycosyltransferase n=1 Tax=Halomarina litorea TaxID=2961595 RepID=UPI0020C3BDF8|nr:glycosyltransferase [Halomarina sp. BCD28]
MPTVGLVIPAFSPDPRALSTYVRALDEYLAPETIRIELDDPTPELVGRLADLPATVNAFPYRRGKGAAITDGFEALDTDILAFADADGSTPARSIVDVVTPLLTGEVDVCVGSRRHPEAVVQSHQTHARRRMGDAFAWLARRALEADLYDYQCGAKALTRDAWVTVRQHLYEPGFAWDIEFVAIAAAFEYRIREVPVTWCDSPNSTVSPVRTAVSMGRSLLTARHRAKRLQDHGLHRALPADDTTALVDRQGGTDR